MYRFTNLRVFVALLLLLPGMCFSTMPTQAGKAKIAHVGVITNIDAKAYDTPDLTSLPVKSFREGDKVVVLDRTSRFVEILLENGDEAYLSPVHVVNRDPVTLDGAMAKVKYFEKMADGASQDEQVYYDSQAAPWVALVARHLSRQKDVGTLPPLSGESSPDRSAPQLNVVNNTRYTLRLYMAGTRTVSRRISPGATFTDDFPAGKYKVVVESTSGGVIPLRTSWDIKVGHIHTITLTIVRR